MVSCFSKHVQYSTFILSTCDCMLSSCNGPVLLLLVSVGPMEATSKDVLICVFYYVWDLELLNLQSWFSQT